MENWKDFVRLFFCVEDRRFFILTNMADGNNAVFVGIDPRAIRWLRRAWGVTPYRKNSILINMADGKNVVSVGSDAPRASRVPLLYAVTRSANRQIGGFEFYHKIN